MSIQEAYSSCNILSFVYMFVCWAGGVIRKVPVLQSILICKTLLNHQCLCANDSNHAEISNVSPELQHPLEQNADYGFMCRRAEHWQ